MDKQLKSSRTCGRAVAAQIVEPLEGRTLFSGVSLDPSPMGFRGLLNVTGDDNADDVISVRTDSTQTQVVVTINGEEQQRFDVSSIREIVVNGLGGDDKLSVDDSFDFGKTRIYVILDGGDGNDTLTGGPSGEAFRGGAGDDVIDAGGGFNVIQGGDGDDLITAGDGMNLIMTGNGDNTVRTGDGNDRVLCGTGDDDVQTGTGNDLVAGGGGADTINVGNGNNNASGGAGDDKIYAGTGNDLLRGNGGDDTIDGGGGDDTILQDDPAKPAPPEATPPFKTSAGARRHPWWWDASKDGSTFGIPRG